MHDPETDSLETAVVTLDNEAYKFRLPVLLYCAVAYDSSCPSLFTDIALIGHGMPLLFPEMHVPDAAGYLEFVRFHGAPVSAE